MNKTVILVGFFISTLVGTSIAFFVLSGRADLTCNHKIEIFEYLKFGSTLLTIFLGFIYFIFTYTNQQRSVENAVKQKKIDYVFEILADIENSFSDSTKFFKKSELDKFINYSDLLNAFLESHKVFFSISDDDQEPWLRLSSLISQLESEKNVDDPTRINVLASITNIRVNLWGTLKY